MDDFYNTDDDKISSGCADSSSLCIPKRHASLILAGLLALLFFTFITGYFWGKRTAISQLTSRVEEEFFANQIQSSLYGLQDRPGVQQEVIPEIALDQRAQESVDSEQQVVSVNEQKVDIEVEMPSKQYYAQLIGFGTQGAANSFAKRANKITEVEVKKRVSKTAKGKTRVWYQVVTAPSSNREDLELLVAKISKEERLKGVHIVTC